MENILVYFQINIKKLAEPFWHLDLHQDCKRLTNLKNKTLKIKITTYSSNRNLEVKSQNHTHIVFNKDETN